MYSPAEFIEGKYILIDKPIGWTSHDVVAKIRGPLKHFCGDKKMKIGHAGTLDPLATGLLIIVTGKMTKQAEAMQNLDKEYTGTITLGAVTDSYDKETELRDLKDLSGITNEKILAVAAAFNGEQEQAPPQYSSVKVSGVRAYQYARQGDVIELKKRNIVIHDLLITSIQLPEVQFKVHCSKGTYIRSLAHDMGQALGCGGYLSSLCRTKVGTFDIADAILLGDFLRSIGAKNLPA